MRRRRRKCCGRFWRGEIGREWPQRGTKNQKSKATVRRLSRTLRPKRLPVHYWLTKSGLPVVYLEACRSSTPKGCISQPEVAPRYRPMQNVPMRSRSRRRWVGSRADRPRGPRGRSRRRLNKDGASVRPRGQSMTRPRTAVSTPSLSRLPARGAHLGLQSRVWLPRGTKQGRHPRRTRRGLGVGRLSSPRGGRRHESAVDVGAGRPASALVGARWDAHGAVGGANVLHGTLTTSIVCLFGRRDYGRSSVFARLTHIDFCPGDRFSLPPQSAGSRRGVRSVCRLHWTSLQNPLPLTGGSKRVRVLRTRNPGDHHPGRTGTPGHPSRGHRPVRSGGKSKIGSARRPARLTAQPGSPAIPWSPSGALSGS